MPVSSGTTGSGDFGDVVFGSAIFEFNALLGLAPFPPFPVSALSLFVFRCFPALSFPV